MNEESLRQKKLEELKQLYSKQQEEEQKESEAQMQASSILKKFVDENGIERLSNVKLVNKELYFKAVGAVMQLAQKGYVNGKISDEQAKHILMQLKTDREFTIKRK